MINRDVCAIKRFCKDYTKIENYDKAVTDDTQTWHIHHRLETHFSDGTPRPKNAFLSMDELKALDMYYNRPPEELIFLTRAEHNVVHFRGRPRPEKVKQMMSKTLRGRKQSEEWIRKRTDARRGKPRSEESKRKNSEAMKGKRWKLIDGKHVYY